VKIAESKSAARWNVACLKPAYASNLASTKDMSASKSADSKLAEPPNRALQKEKTAKWSAS
jgi:hypothetical protein